MNFDIVSVFVLCVSFFHTIAKDVLMKPFQHVSIERFVAFLLYAKPLSRSEYSHLLECSQCRQTMMSAGAEELRRREKMAA
jgi:hypothetical protein